MIWREPAFSVWLELISSMLLLRCTRLHYRYSFIPQRTNRWTRDNSAENSVLQTWGLLNNHMYLSTALSKVNLKLRIFVFELDITMMVIESCPLLVMLRFEVMHHQRWHYDFCRKYVFTQQIYYEQDVTKGQFLNGFRILTILNHALFTSSMRHKVIFKRSFKDLDSVFLLLHKKSYQS